MANGIRRESESKIVVVHDRGEKGMYFALAEMVRNDKDLSGFEVASANGYDAVALWMWERQQLGNRASIYGAIISSSVDRSAEIAGKLLREMRGTPLVYLCTDGQGPPEIKQNFLTVDLSRDIDVGLRSARDYMRGMLLPQICSKNPRLLQPVGVAIGG